MNTIDLGRVRGPSGADGANGKSAFEYAVEGGYPGTEDDFKELMSKGPWIPTTQKGTPEGVAVLTEDGIVPDSQLPAYTPLDARGDTIAPLEGGKVPESYLPPLGRFREMTESLTDRQSGGLYAMVLTDFTGSDV